MRRLTQFTHGACAIIAIAAAIAPAAGAPTATTTAATDIAATSATLNGTVGANGTETTYFFQYGSSTTYGSQTTARSAGKGNNERSVDADVAGLVPSTTYHYRVVAQNSAGTVNGADMTFTTPAAGASTPLLSLAANARTVTFGKPVTFTGTLSGPGNAGQTVTLEANPAPFAGFKSTGQSATTDASGNYSIILAPGSITNFRAVSGKGKDTTTSPEVAVRVRVKVTLKISDRTPSAGQRVKFSGFVLPGHDGKVAKIQKRVSGKWRTVATAPLVTATPVGATTRSSYAKRLRINSDGRYRVRVAPGDGDHLAGSSRAKSVDVG